jgi:hypothetical protein
VCDPLASGRLAAVRSEPLDWCGSGVGRHAYQLLNSTRQHCPRSNWAELDVRRTMPAFGMKSPFALDLAMMALRPATEQAAVTWKSYRAVMSRMKRGQGPERDTPSAIAR